LTDSVATCKDIYGFLDAVRQRSALPPLPDPEISNLQQIGWVDLLTADEYRALSTEVASLAAAQAALTAEQASRARLAAEVAADARRTHSILFRLEGHETQEKKLQRQAEDAEALRSSDTELAARVQAFDALLQKRSLLETAVPLGDRYVGLTGRGAVEARDLGVRLYRFSDQPLSAYWQEAQATRAELGDLAARGSSFVGALTPPLGGVDRSYVWAIAIGLAKRGSDIAAGARSYLEAYSAIGPLADNPENRLLSAEVLTALPTPVADAVPLLRQLDAEVRQLGVAKPSSLGVSSILLLGRRQDGTFATENLRAFLGMTRSFESAALLAILNRPVGDLSAKFLAARERFTGWGYEPSEDVELASAYLTLSDLPLDGLDTKLAIVSRGMARYLEYPLVAASILASIPVLEANETLNLLEEAYEIVGARAMPMEVPELICLAVRMIHGIRSETVGSLDTTATPAPADRLTYGASQRFLFVPVMVVHGSYYSTFSGVGGIHPGHVHFAGGALAG
jgi:hypothetical protein